MADFADRLRAVLAPEKVLDGDAVGEDMAHDEALTVPGRRPDAVVVPTCAEDVAAVVRLAAGEGVPVTARGAGTGLCGACVPRAGGVVVAFDRMSSILEVDTDNHVAVVEPGVRLDQLDAGLAGSGLVYPVYPGETTSSIGGNIGTNAGGMRAVRHGVTRHHVLGLQAVLGTGEILRSGGRYVKSTSGYDLTQLIVGSEGTLAIVTEATLRLHPRIPHAATLLAPFPNLSAVTAAVPPIVASGVQPTILEYVDAISMAGITSAAELDLGVPRGVQERALAYLVVVVEERTPQRLDESVEHLGALVAGLGALDVYVLPAGAATALVEARERAFFAAKAAGADDIVDCVVPRARIADYLARVAALAEATGSLVVGCGHAGDGNVHLSVFQRDAESRGRLVRDILAAGVELGGAVSGEHGIGTAKLAAYLELEDPAKLALMRRIKAAFDPAGILNPGVLLP
ncbi:MAG TPA: FAD-binding oxidoreductase [Candidatus Dormibacteraeota bacterium]|nr:FAD-binding oxidoreductase [Candidatus Dormibacteraeota bacterium]